VHDLLSAFYKVVQQQQHNLGDVANSIRHCEQIIGGNNGERIIKIDPRLTVMLEIKMAVFDSHQCM